MTVLAIAKIAPTQIDAPLPSLVPEVAGDEGGALPSLTHAGSPIEDSIVHRADPSAQLRANLTQFYSQIVVWRLQPFIEGRVDVVEEKRRQSTPDHLSFLKSTTLEFDFCFPAGKFDQRRLLEEYLEYAIVHMNGIAGIKRIYGREEVYHDYLSQDERQAHVAKMTSSLREAVLIDFDGLELNPEELKLKIEKEVDKFYQGLMWVEASKMALEVSRGHSKILSWEAKDWKRGFCIAVESKFGMDLTPETRNDIELFIERLLAARAKKEVK